MAAGVIYFSVVPLWVGVLAARDASGDAIRHRHDGLEHQAREQLWQVMRTEQTWVRVHAAEALIHAGEAVAVREFFLKDLVTTEKSIFRVGVWRVLAQTSASETERRSWIKNAEEVFQDLSATDRSQAIETLCKLGHPVSGATLDAVRAEVASGPSPRRLLSLWAEALLGQPGALAELRTKLESADVAERRTSAYALRWLHSKDPATQAALRSAVARTPAGAEAKSYFLTAALASDADPTEADAWRAELTTILFQGVTADRFEAAQTLRHNYPKEKVPTLAPLLEDPENDVRVAAAEVILAP